MYTTVICYKKKKSKKKNIKTSIIFCKSIKQQNEIIIKIWNDFYLL